MYLNIALCILCILIIGTLCVKMSSTLERQPKNLIEEYKNVVDKKFNKITKYWKKKTSNLPTNEDEYPITLMFYHPALWHLNSKTIRILYFQNKHGFWMSPNEFGDMELTQEEKEWIVINYEEVKRDFKKCLEHNIIKCREIIQKKLKAYDSYNEDIMKKLSTIKKIKV